MTDTIGWGDVEVEPRRRRRMRVPRRLVWPTAAVVAAAVVLTPRLQSHLADGAAAWLQQQWAAAAALDVSRSAIELSATDRLGVGEEAAFARAIDALDREEIARLGRIDRAVATHHTWAGDVHKVAEAVHAALAAQIVDLEHDVGLAASGVEKFRVAPMAMSLATQERTSRVDALVTAMARRHHTPHFATPKAALSAATGFDRQLHNVVDTPLDTRLAISRDGTVDVWDLETGRVIRTVSFPNADPESDGGLVAIGSSLLVDHGGDESILPANGDAVPLPFTPVGFTSAGGEGLWDFTDNAHVLRFDAAGRRVGPTYTLPAHAEVGGFAATTQAIALQLYDASGDGGLGSSREVVWSPSTGQERSLPGNCDGIPAGAAHFLAYLDCEGENIQVLDVDTGMSRRVRVPAGYSVLSALSLAPDGRRVAVELVPRRASDQDETQLRLGIADVRTGTVTMLRRSAAPLGWSADASTLLVSVPEDVIGSTLAPLGYWHVGMNDIGPIHIENDGQPFSATLLP